MSVHVSGGLDGAMSCSPDPITVAIGGTVDVTVTYATTATHFHYDIGVPGGWTRTCMSSPNCGGFGDFQSTVYRLQAPVTGWRGKLASIAGADDFGGLGVGHDSETRNVTIIDTLPPLIVPSITITLGGISVGSLLQLGFGQCVDITVTIVGNADLDGELDIVLPSNVTASSIVEVWTDKLDTHVYVITICGLSSPVDDNITFNVKEGGSLAASMDLPVIVSAYTPEANPVNSSYTPEDDPIDPSYDEDEEC